MLVESMPLMIESASNFGLKKTLAFHLAETDQHKIAIAAICKQFDIDPARGEPDMELQNILQQSQGEMINLPQGDERDAFIIAGALKIEEYEIATYEPVANDAEQLGYKGIAQRLRLTMEEERQSDTKLKFLASSLFSERSEIGTQQVQVGMVEKIGNQ